MWLKVITTPHTHTHTCISCRFKEDDYYLKVLWRKQTCTSVITQINALLQLKEVLLVKKEQCTLLDHPSIPYQSWLSLTRDYRGVLEPVPLIAKALLDNTNLLHIYCWPNILTLKNDLFSGCSMAVNCEWLAWIINILKCLPSTSSKQVSLFHKWPKPQSYSRNNSEIFLWQP